MKILENYDLTQLNTLGVSARAKFFAMLNTEEDLPELFTSDIFKNNSKLFLGGGSNVLFTRDFEGIVILNKLKGIEILQEDEESVQIRAMGGESWHDLVAFSVERGYWGIENLALIPGTVGAAPMQNIGAYGAELKDVLENVEAYDIGSGGKRIFSKAQCEFGYRDSVFKNALKGKYFISAITIGLSKTEKKNLEYKVLAEYLERNNLEARTSQDVSNVVSAIRKSRLPDPAVMPNAGSFFKNVFLDENDAREFLIKYPDAPHFQEDDVVKIPAAWLIEQASWKGYRVGNVGVHNKQALVLVNYGGGSGEEIKALSEKIVASVYSKFGLTLIPEVNFI